MKILKIAIVGVGAIGGFVGTRLALAGEDVTFIARGANLAALRGAGHATAVGGWRREAVSQVNATDDYARRGSSGCGDPGNEGPPGRSGRPRGANVVRTRHRRGSHAERYSVLVLLPVSAVNWPARGCRASIPPALIGESIPCESRHRLRRVPGGRVVVARGDQAR